MPETIAAARQEALAKALWPSDQWSFMKTWAILDGARDARIAKAVERTSEPKCCLFAGNISAQLKEVAPYLVRLDRGDDLAELLLEQGWGRAWGVFFTSSGSLDTLRKHFRRFLRVTDEAGRRLLFRYYDPRVLSIYLPTCNDEELTTVFSPLERFVMEADEGRTAMEFRYSGVRLKTNRLDLDSTD